MIIYIGVGVMLGISMFLIVYGLLVFLSDLLIEGFDTWVTTMKTDWKCLKSDYNEYLGKDTTKE